MRPQRKQESHLVDELRIRADRKAGQKKTAEELGIAAQTLCDVLKQRRPVTERLAKAMGYKRVIEFEKL